MKRHCTVVFLLLFSLVVGKAYALPRFAASTGLKCQNCHVDPNGGGMRNYYGVMMYGRETLPVPGWTDDSTVLNFSTQLNDFISAGVDMQTLYYSQRERNYSSFVQMEGDIYISARLSKKVAVVAAKSIFNDYEFYGIAQVLPLNGYIKAGRFTPAYGTRIDDHTTFIRTKTVFPLFRRPDTGVEIGFSQPALFWNGGVYNGEGGADPSNGKIRLFTTRAETFFRIERINFSIGGSYWYNNGAAGTMTMYGGFAGIGIGDLTVNVEADMKKDKAVLGLQEFISYAEFDYLLTEGLDLKFIYDFYDPDIDLKTGTSTRYSFGVEFFPFPGVELRPLYRIIRNLPGQQNEKEIDIILHLFL